MQTKRDKTEEQPALINISLNMSVLAGCMIFNFSPLARCSETVMVKRYYTQKTTWRQTLQLNIDTEYRIQYGTLNSFLSCSQPPRTSGNTAVTAVQVPGPVQVLDRDLAHAPAAEAETTSSKALPRYRCVRVCVLPCSAFPWVFILLWPHCKMKCKKKKKRFLSLIIQKSYYNFLLRFHYWFWVNAWK